MSAVVALLERWRVRDERYRTRQGAWQGLARTQRPVVQITPAEEQAIRSFRRQEIESLPAPERAPAWLSWREWIPPVSR